MHDFVANWCWNLRCHHITKVKPDPFYTFLSGVGGVGKGHALKAVYHATIQTLKEAGTNPEEVCTILTAPTGTAAFNINDMTIHSALILPIKQGYQRKTLENSYIALGSDKRNTLRCKLQSLKVLIIIYLLSVHDWSSNAD